MSFANQVALLRGHRWLVVAGGVAVAGLGLGLGWNTLAALGLLPIVLVALPCAAMCALGLCMMPKKGHRPSTVRTPPAGGSDHAES